MLKLAAGSVTAVACGSGFGTDVASVEDSDLMSQVTNELHRSLGLLNNKMVCLGSRLIDSRTMKSHSLSCTLVKPLYPTPCSHNNDAVLTYTGDAVTVENQVSLVNGAKEVLHSMFENVDVCVSVTGASMNCEMSHSHQNHTNIDVTSTMAEAKVSLAICDNIADNNTVTHNNCSNDLSDTNVMLDNGTYDDTQRQSMCYDSCVSEKNPVHVTNNVNDNESVSVVNGNQSFPVGEKLTINENKENISIQGERIEPASEADITAYKLCSEACQQISQLLTSGGLDAIYACWISHQLNHTKPFRSNALKDAVITSPTTETSRLASGATSEANVTVANDETTGTKATALRRSLSLDMSKEITDKDITKLFSSPQTPSEVKCKLELNNQGMIL